jgi:hypothetical protein
VVDSYHVFHDGSDRSHYHREERFWKLGDSNHDGLFNSSDLVAVFTAGEYEDGVPGNSTWEEGDWNRDGDFDSSDFTTAFAAGGYEEGPIYAQASKVVTRDLALGLAERDKMSALDQLFASDNMGDLIGSLE